MDFQKRHTQKWFIPDSYEEISRPFLLGFGFACAIVTRKENGIKIKYFIRACEGLFGPDYLRILSRSGDDLKKRVIPKLIKLNDN